MTYTVTILSKDVIVVIANCTSFETMANCSVATNIKPTDKLGVSMVSLSLIGILIFNIKFAKFLKVD